MRKLTRRDLPWLTEVFRGYLLQRDRSAVLHAGLGNADVSKQRTFGDARALGVYPSASADQLGAKGSRQVAQFGLGCRHNRCSHDSDLIGRRSRDLARFARERQRLVSIEIESGEIDEDVKALLSCLRERAEFRDFGIGIEMGYNSFALSSEAG
ncbi:MULTISPECIES: hypothetical protein [unclassified Bradyrhizobium]|uniref:hypothetical protein n=1 Tax=unclassified Bradyrhizobium TaxID=2631580 RepID=UPI001FF9745D|nr:MULTISPECIES: hypothetical protein [unclassified Bradyrhizobium]